jgi:site-specific recombinase XerD
MTLLLSSAVEEYLKMVQISRSENTHLTYRKALEHFSSVVQSHHLDPQKLPAADLTEEAVTWSIQSLKFHAASTERLYLTAITGFFEFLSANNATTVNLQKIRLLIKQRARKPGIRLPQFPKDAIGIVLDSVESFPIIEEMEINNKLRLLRDKAFLLTLGETGLRVHEACNLIRGDMDWNEGRAQVIGKGNREAVVRFSRRAQKAINDYLQLRAGLDHQTGKNMGALPIFARHDKGVGKKIKAITTTTGRNIVAEWIEKVLGKEAVGSITPHSFRHYFVTRVLQSSGNLKLAQDLARHKNIAVTQRYAHLANNELDKGYWDVFESDNNNTN